MPLVYLAGPLFTKHERMFLDEVATALRASGLSVFVPHEQSYPPGPVSPAMCFAKDGEGLFTADAVVAVLNGPMIDDGTACEIGLFYGLHHEVSSPSAVIVGLVTDSRRREANDHEYEAGAMNLYVRGCIDAMGCVVNDIDAAVSAVNTALKLEGAST